MAEKTLHKQTDRQTDRHYENNAHLALNQLLRPREPMRSIAMSASVCCLYVCLSVRYDIFGTTRAIFAEILCVLPMSVAPSSSGMLTIGRIAYRREGIFCPIDNAL